MKRFKIREFSPIWWAGMMFSAAATATGVCALTGLALAVWEVMA